ncbi:hypothetical protein Trydic_g7859 [Trypoxylus dichotomus]
MFTRENVRQSHVLQVSHALRSKSITRALSPLRVRTVEVRRQKHRLPKSSLVMPGTLWCGHQDVAPAYNALGIFGETDKCCRRHDYCQRNIHAFNRKYELLNQRPFTISHCFCDASRPKRDMVGDLLRIPGTHWCGKGYSANKYTQLGFFSKTDKCCRTHDLACPFWIGAMDTKFGLHNFRANTLMHCSCDERWSYFNSANCTLIMGVAICSRRSNNTQTS